MKTVTFFLLGLLCNTSIAQQARILQADQVEESCHKLPAGQTIHYRFSADQPLEFNIHYHEDNQVLFPLTRILHRNPEFSRRDFCPDCSNGQKPMLFIGLQGVRASWVKRSREKPDSMTGTNCVNKSTTATKLRFTVEKN